ncbi:YheT family hydrolase [Candidatus Igneacidithiobacillus taiwanensis]|uniref:YheT family hydrolase n=1 Tax=Candidatus Igneacidithiobacillus taiwanensis TaxID=1945924 RepID=UPI0028A1E023|nr:alpha/beta fold hydrolase [Candidatus Igneacidithiobacillus taiwanensis]
MTLSCDFRPPFWLPNGDAETLWAPFFSRSERVPLRRELWTTPDDDQIAVDWVDGDPQAPAVVLFHGLGSSSRGHYSLALAAALQARRWTGCLVNFRGCGGLDNRKPRAYHAGDSDEIAWIVERLQRSFSTLYAVGVSLGGNALLKYLGEERGDHLTAAVAVCAPVDLVATAAHIAQRPLYERYFVRTLQRQMGHYASRYPDLVDWQAVHSARTLRAFDDAFTAPVHGFRDALSYWQQGSSGPGLARVRVPTLLINSRNDPIVPLADVAKWQRSAAVQTCFTDRGGHVAYVQGSFPGHTRYLPQQILRFFDGDTPDAKA